MKAVFLPTSSDMMSEQAKPSETAWMAAENELKYYNLPDRPYEFSRNYVFLMRISPDHFSASLSSFLSGSNFLPPGSMNLLKNST